MFVVLNLYLKERLYAQDTEKSEIRNHITRDVAGISAKEKEKQNARNYVKPKPMVSGSGILSGIHSGSGRLSGIHKEFKTGLRISQGLNSKTGW